MQKLQCVKYSKVTNYVCIRSNLIDNLMSHQSIKLVQWFFKVDESSGPQSKRV